MNCSANDKAKMLQVAETGCGVSKLSTFSYSLRAVFFEQIGNLEKSLDVHMGFSQGSQPTHPKCQVDHLVLRLPKPLAHYLRLISKCGIIIVVKI